MIIATFTNAEDGTQAIVRESSAGFSVVLKDLDADQVLPVSRHFKTQEPAYAYAEKIACAGRD